MPVDLQLQELILPPHQAGSARGWLTVRDNPVLSLDWVPTALLRRMGSGPQAMQRIWQELVAPPKPHQLAAEPPSSLALRAASVSGGALRLHITDAQWPGVCASLAQTVDLHPDGAVIPGAGFLRYRGTPQQLIHFMEQQLLPLAGMPLAEPMASSALLGTSDLTADVHWGPSAHLPATFTVQATLRAADWTAHATLHRSDATQHAPAKDFLHLGVQANLAEIIAGGPLQITAASAQLRFLTPLLERAHSAAQQWIAPRAWPSAQATLSLVSQSTHNAWRGDLQVQATHGRWLDHIRGRLHTGASSLPPPPAPAPQRLRTEPAAELEPFEFSAEPLGPVLRAAVGVTRLATGSRFHLSNSTLHELGVVGDDLHATVDIQRYARAQTPWAGAMPQSVWRSVRGVLGVG